MIGNMQLMHAISVAPNPVALHCRSAGATSFTAIHLTRTFWLQRRESAPRAVWVSRPHPLVPISVVYNARPCQFDVGYLLSYCNLDKQQVWTD